jgi:hypothetical protein
MSGSKDDIVPDGLPEDLLGSLLPYPEYFPEVLHVFGHKDPKKATVRFFEQSSPDSLTGEMKELEISSADEMWQAYQRSRKITSKGYAVKKFRQPMYDTAIIEENGSYYRSTLFDLPVGREWKWGQKSYKHTNMTQAGQMGTPLEYIFKRLEFYVAKYSHPEDVKRVLRNLCWEMVMGCDTRIANGTGATLTPVLRGDIDGKLRRTFEKDNIWLHYEHELDKPWWIHSSENFSVRLDTQEPIGELHGPVHLMVLMQDTLIRPWTNGPGER